MMNVTLKVSIRVTDNATEEEVRRAVSRCLHDALHVYAETDVSTPHRLTGGPVHYFRYEMPQVDVTEVSQ